MHRPHELGPNEGAPRDNTLHRDEAADVVGADRPRRHGARAKVAFKAEVDPIRFVAASDARCPVLLGEAREEGGVAVRDDLLDRLLHHGDVLEGALEEARCELGVEVAEVVDADDEALARRLDEFANALLDEEEGDEGKGGAERTHRRRLTRDIIRTWP